VSTWQKFVSVVSKKSTLFLQSMTNGEYCPPRDLISLDNHRKLCFWWQTGILGRLPLRSCYSQCCGYHKSVTFLCNETLTSY